MAGHVATHLFGAALGLGLGLALACAPARAEPAYTLAASLKLGAPDRWDYVVFDPAMQRVYVAHGNAVTVVDAASLTIAGSLEGLDGAHGTAPVPALGKVFADSGKQGTVVDFDAKTFAPLATIKALSDADGMIYDAASGQVVVLGGEAGAAGFIDPRTDRLTATLALGGSPEGVAVDGAGTMYVALADHDQLAVVDTRARRVLARWDLPGCHDPHGVAMDPAAARVFVSCPAGQMAVMDAGNGHEVALLAIGKGSDSADFDPSRHVARSSNRAGTRGIVGGTAAGLRALDPVATLPGARTMAVDPATGRVFVVTATATGAEAATPGHRPRLAFAPGTLRLLVYAPQGAAP